MAPDRAGLVRIGIREARANGWIGRRARVVLVGDAPADVFAAKANNVRSVAVATGITPFEELADYRPDLIVPSLARLTPEELIGG
jgi:phosphoglycolate phosphatase-like HAD superfamily hydrolase